MEGEEDQRENIPLHNIPQDDGQGNDDWDFDKTMRELDNIKFEDDPNNRNVEQRTYKPTSPDYSSSSRDIGKNEQETSFTTDLDEFLDGLDPDLGDKMKRIFREIDIKDRRKVPEKVVRNTLVESIKSNALLDVLDDYSWDLQILDESKKRFYLEQRVAILNRLLHGRLIIDPSSTNAFELIDRSVLTSYTGELQRANGMDYKVKGKAIVRRNPQGEFYLKEGKHLDEFYKRCKNCTR